MSNDPVTSGEAEEIAGVNRVVLLRYVKSGKLIPARKLPGKRGTFLFHRADILALAAERRAELQAQLDRLVSTEAAS